MSCIKSTSNADNYNNHSSITIVQCFYMYTSTPFKLYSIPLPLHMPAILPIPLQSLNNNDNNNMLQRGPNLFFKYFYFLFGPGLFYPLRVLAKVQIFFGSLAEPLTRLHPKMGTQRTRNYGFSPFSLPCNKNLSGHNQAPW